LGFGLRDEGFGCSVARNFEDTTPCKVTPVILHGFITPGLRVQVYVSVHRFVLVRRSFPRVMRRNFSRESKGRNRIALRQIPLPKSVRQTPLAPDVAGTNAPGLVTRLVQILHGLVNRIGRHWRSFSRVQGYLAHKKQPPPLGPP